MAAMKRNRNKTPKIFYLIYAIAMIIAVIIAVLLPLVTPLKIMIGMLLVVALSFGGVWLYAKFLRK